MILDNKNLGFKIEFYLIGYGYFPSLWSDLDPGHPRPDPQP